ncbi:MAG: hypothetical protein E7329_03445 [Clostridiales bacterium]|nr:hypothetical protein [Clostridiales bacterium]
MIKDHSCRPGGGCYSPEPPRPSGAFLMQRILGKGQLHRRRACYSLCLCACSSHDHLQLLDVTVSGNPQWEEIPCHERGAILLQVTVPLLLRIRDENGCVFSKESSLNEQLRIRLSCREEESWRGQIFVQAAVRLAGCARMQAGCFEAPLEVMLEGYILSPCAMGASCPPPCPEPKPWYPQPRFDPWNDR